MKLKEVTETIAHRDSSLCCHATVTIFHQPNAMENEVSEIKICTACNSEAPRIGMFQDWTKVPLIFIEMNAHKTNIPTIISRQELTPSLKQKPYYIKK